MMLTFKVQSTITQGKKKGKWLWVKHGLNQVIKLLSTRAWILRLFLVCISERHVIEIIKKVFSNFNYSLDTVNSLVYKIYMVIVPRATLYTHEDGRTIQTVKIKVLWNLGLKTHTTILRWTILPFSISAQYSPTPNCDAIQFNFSFWTKVSVLP